MPRFNFTNIIGDDEADIDDIMNNFNLIEQYGALLTDLLPYQTKSAQSNTVSSSSTNDTYASSKAVFDALAIEKLTSTLALVDGTDCSLTMSRYYKIPGLSVNGITNSIFNNSIIYVYKSSGETFLVLIDSANMKLSNPMYLFVRYYYHNGAWILQNNKYIEYSTTDLTAGTSALPTGSIYFVYE